jgi:hypothetical protein
MNKISAILLIGITIVFSCKTIDYKENASLFSTTELQILSLQESRDLYKQIIELYTLLKRQDPNEFVELYNKAITNEGKMYALIGLYLLGDTENYNNYKEEMNDTDIYFRIADVSSKAKAAYLLKQLESGNMNEFLFWNVDPKTWEIILKNGERKKIFE